MGNYSIDEITDAFVEYQAAAAEGGATGNWERWAECFTEDASYLEHLYGRFEGRAAILEWISSTMSVWPNSAFTSFPIDWWTIDADKGWVICKVWNRLEDPGDGSVHQEYNITILHYAGHGMWSYEEDIYNPEPFANVVKNWINCRRSLGQPDGM
jgi:hypothetical protein